MPYRCAHERFSRICHVARMSTPYIGVYIESQKMVALPIPFSCRAPAIFAFCWPTTQTPSITISLVAVVHTKPVTANLVRNWLPWQRPLEPRNRLRFQRIS